MIIVSVTGPSVGQALMQVNASRRYAAMFEIRLDLIRTSGHGIPRLISAARRPVILTCRPLREGGSFRGTERERMEILRRATSWGVDYVDVEADAGEGFIRPFLAGRSRTKVMISRHRWSEGAGDVRSVYRELRSSGADVVKFAFLAADASENRMAFDFLSLASAEGRKAIAVAMGDDGEASRVLYRKFGGWATFASPENGAPSAPGQMPASALTRVYRADRLNRATKIFGVVGNPLGQSKGVYIHNEVFRKAGRNAVYCKFRVEDLGKFMDRMAPLMSGFSVTIPHKEGMLNYLDRVEPAARNIGAVNTVIRRRGLLSGLNTDAPAALDALEARARVRGKTVLVLGAGGAARAIAYEARRRGASVMIANRSERRARRVAEELGVRTVDLKDIGEIPYDILVNATPVGMVPHEHRSPVHPGIRPGTIVFDAVYNPPITMLLQEARRAGARIVPGTEMYLNQAARQSALFTGHRADKALMRKMLFRHL